MNRRYRELQTGTHKRNEADLARCDPGSTAAGTFYELLGGEAGLRPIINTFIDRVFDDQMIGFFFRAANRNRIKEMEFQFTARFLGADLEYQGRPIEEVHARHPIMGGQFARRLQILKKTLEDYNVPPTIREAWTSHIESLRALITKDAGSDCDPGAAREKATLASTNSAAGKMRKNSRV